MKLNKSTGYFLSLSLSIVAMFCLTAIATTEMKAQSPSFTVKKDVCDALGSQNGCVQGNNRELDGTNVKFTVALQSDPGAVIETFLVPINNGSGQASPMTRFDLGLELRVCEIEVPRFFDATPQPERSTGGQFRAEGDCIIFTTAQGNQQLQFANVRDDLTPTAAMASVTGRVLNARGRGVSKAKVLLTDSNGVTHMFFTNGFGHFRFEVPAGESYILGAFHKSYRIAPRVITLTENLSEQNLVAQ